jgi:hypothetical protein
VGAAVDLEGVGFAGPALDPVDGAAYVATAVGSGDAQTVWLTRVERSGAVAWRVPVGEGFEGGPSAPVAFDAGVWVAFRDGARSFDRVGKERDVIAGRPAPGRLAVSGQGRLAWVTADGGSLVVRASATGSLEHAVALSGGGGAPAAVGPVFATGGDQVLLGHGGVLVRHSADDGSPAGEVSTFAGDVRALAVNAGRAYVLDGARRVGAFVLASGALPEAWAIDLDADAVPALTVDEGGRLVLPMVGGGLRVLDDLGTSAAEHVLERGEGTGAHPVSLLADGWLVRVTSGGLAAGRLVGQGDQVRFEALWTHHLGNGLVGSPLADPDGHLWVLDGAGRLGRLVSGASGPARSGWPTPAGAEGQGGIEAGVLIPDSKEE